MRSHQSCAALKASAKEHMFGHYGSAIGVYLIVTLLTGFATLSVTSLTGNTVSIFGTCIHYALLFAVSVFTGLLSSGTAYFYLKIVTGHPSAVSDVFYGFHMEPEKALSIQAWITLLSFLGSLPEYIVLYHMSGHPDTSVLTQYGLCMILSSLVALVLDLLYAPAFFLMHDFPQHSARELLTMSRKLMVGNKGRLFYLYLSYLPLLLLGVLSCGIALLWVFPYLNATLAEFYMDVIKHSETSDH